jgi:hypothetical protein
VGGKDLKRGAKRLGEALLRSLRDLLPIIVVVGLFQAFVFRQPLEDVMQTLVGLVTVVVGLTLFIFGLEMGLFPLGDSMAHDFARKGSLAWLLAFAFSLGFGTTIAEPALIAVAQKAGELAAVNAPPEEQAGRQLVYQYVLRGTVAAAVGMALVVGVLRILKGWPVHYLIMGGYVIVMLLTPWTSESMVAIAYDSGGVTTSTITVPLATALGVGLASSIKGRNPLLDGFGLIAFASITPIMFVLLLGIFWA